MIIAGVYTLIALVTFLAIGAVLRRFGLLSLGCLMDDGDGQGGVPPLPRRARKQAALGDYVAARQAAALPREPTRLIKLGDLVAYPELERYAQQKAAQQLTEIIGHHGHADASLGDLDPDPGLGGER